jgi:hypothetical protein
MDRKLAVAAIGLLAFTSAKGALAEDKEPLAVVMLGGAAEWSFPDRASSRGPSVAIEFSAIKDWLEVEVGGAKMFRPGHSEWEGEVVFRKPFTLSETAEMMVGLGPIWTRARGEKSKLGTTFVADFMFWQTPEHKWGWFAEPSYSVGRERSLAISVGLLIGIN